MFEEFWVQSPLRTNGFSDVPLELPKDTPNLHDTYPAKHMTRYLEEYVDSHVYNAKSLRDRIRLNSGVSSIEKLSNGWLLQVGGAKPHTIRCTKLAVAPGLTSIPNMPEFPRSNDWTAPILHHRDFGAQSEAILAPSSAYGNITVLGGGKSAADLVYASVKAGKNVNWIIRISGEGPGVFMNPAGVGRYKHSMERSFTQRATIFNPSCFRPMLWWAQLQHQSISGRPGLEQKLFAGDRVSKTWPNYQGREGALSGFRDLEPKASAS